MGFFAKSKGAGMFDDRRKDVKTFKTVMKIILFPLWIVWKLIKFGFRNMS